MPLSKFIALAALALAAAPAAAATTPAGLWMNPYGSVAVRAGPCGDRLCGWVAWASGEAQSDAKDGGVTKLVGTELLEDYRPARGGAWIGTVFVPDMGRHFASQIRQTSPSQLKVKGCILGGLICRSQVWTRIEQLPRA